MRIQKTMIAFLVVVTGTFALTLTSCERERGCGETNISSHGGDDSHNNGRNCFSCHTSGGEGEGCFNAAGTTYKSSGSAAKNGTVKLYTGENSTGTLRATIEVDNLGNFYTTDDINFSGGLYPTIISATGNVYEMSDNITTGACNSCHGVSTDRLEID